MIGLENSHCIADGLGTAQFLNALAEFARGLPFPSIPPIWCPSAIPSPPTKSLLTPQALPPPPSFHLQKVTIDVSLELIASFKSHFLSIAHQPCSTFEALAAILWQSRTRAILTNANFTEVRLVFMANARPLVHPALPQGFCSNCFFPVNVLASSEWLASATVVDVVQLIKKAKARLPEEFRRWVAGEGEDPYLPALGYATFFLSEWNRLGFEKVDYGWGSPKQVVPLMYNDIIPVCILGLPPAPANGVRLSTQCVEEEHLQQFEESMKKAWGFRGWEEERKI